MVVVVVGVVIVLEVLQEQAEALPAVLSSEPDQTNFVDTEASLLRALEWNKG